MSKINDLKRKCQMLIEHKKEILNQFKCQKSGNCCKADGFVFVSKENITNMSRELNLSEFEFRQKYTRKHNGWEIVASPNFQQNCFLTCNKTCRVYKSRPSACQTYPNWPSIWKSDMTLLKEAETCPGLKKSIESTLNQLSDQSQII